MIYGIGTHVVTGNVTSSKREVTDLKANSTRDDITWNTVELSVNSWALPANAYSKIEAWESVGTENICILAYGSTARGIGQPYTQSERDAFAEYVAWLVPQIKHTCRYFEIWNEWNNGSGISAAQTSSGIHSGATEYAQLVATVSPVIRSLAPSSKILAGATSGRATTWFQEAVTAGLIQYVDGLSSHPYSHGLADASPGPEMTRMQTSHDSIVSTNGGLEFDAYITEIGWPTHTTGETAPVAAQYLSHFYKLAESKSWIKGVWWYDIFDDGTDSADQEHRFGLFANDAITPKPAAHAYRALMNRTRVDQNGWVRVAVTAAVETEINAGSSPTRIKWALINLRSLGTTVVIDSITLNEMTGPIDLAVLDDIGERFANDFIITEGPVVRGVTPAQTTATRTTTWPNGWT